MHLENQTEHKLALRIAATVFVAFLSVVFISGGLLFLWKNEGERAMLEGWFDVLSRDGRMEKILHGQLDFSDRGIMNGGGGMGKRMPPGQRNIIVLSDTFKAVYGPLSFVDISDFQLPNIQEEVFVERDFMDRRFVFLGKPIGGGTVWLYASSEGEIEGAIFRIIVSCIFAIALFVVALYFIARHLAKESFSSLKKSLEVMGLYNRQIAHELRTPLAVLRSDLELAVYSKDLTQIEESLAEIGNIEKIINSLLFLAENPKVEKKETVNMSAVFEEKWRLLGKKYPNVAYNPSKEPIQVMGNGELLNILAGVLLENAAEHSADSKIFMGMSENGFIVRNTLKKEIPKTVQDAIFEPFFKFDSNGSGLGLSIAKKIAMAHGWSISFLVKEKQVFVEVNISKKIKKQKV